ncbi:MAG: ABC transporter permease [Acetobacteraceae bacterium]|nr:ABC transporter permease [Acetobacteraceae bacterium]
MLPLRLALRDLRGGVRGLRIVLACLALGVAVIGGVGGLTRAVEQGLAAEGRTILGGDLEIDGGAQPLPETLRAWLRDRGAHLSDIVQMRSMLIAPSGERQLIELKAVDRAWPLVGAADPPVVALGREGLAADPVVLDRLGLRQGDPVRLGTATFRLAGPISEEPDRVGGASLIGARAIIPLASLADTGLIAPGSMVRYALRVTLPEGTDPRAVAASLRAHFANEGWRVRDATEAAPGVSRFVDQTGMFLTLVGLTSLLVGGIGVANGVRAWLEARAASVATLRCLGASGGLIVSVCLIEILALSLIGIAIGLGLGAALPSVVAWLFAGVLPVPLRLGVFPRPLAQAALFGLLTALTFSLWPLGRARHIPAAALFRDVVLPERVRPGWGLVAANALAALSLFALTVATAADRGFALWFSAAAVLALALFRLGGAALMAAARLGPRFSAPWARLGLANLYRPGAATPLMLVSLGLGLSAVSAVALIEGNVRREVADQLPATAPSFFFVDIQTDQLARFETLARAEPGVSEVRQMPTLRARLVAVNGVPADQVRASPETRWALRGDRGLTYAASPPEGTRIVAGTWWPADYRGPPLVSFDANLARGWGVGVGDRLRVNVLGRDIELRVANLRDIAWRSLAMNFTMIASPGLLAGAPHTHIATVRADPASQGRLLRTITDALPNVTGIRVEDILSAIADLLDKIAATLAATGTVALLAGALVLAGAVAASQRRRMHDAVVLKTLGATASQVRAAWLVEFGLLGLAAGLIAAAVGTLASYGVVRFLMGSDWAFLPGRLAASIAACIALMLVFGYAGTASVLRAKAAPLLRND